MKCASILLAAATVPLLGASTDYVNFVYQLQQNTGVRWDVTVPPEGQQISPTGVSPEGSFFQLWSIHSLSAYEYLLDEQFVTAYTPNATVEVVSADPYLPIPRTRVDQPFQVRITVSGLLDPTDPVYPTAPDAAKFAEYIHTSFTFPDGKHSFEGVANPVGTVVDEGWLENNSDSTVTFTMSNLTGPDITQVEGEEVFTIYSQEDFGVTATVLDSDKIQIWPIAQASLSGIDPSIRYESVPPATVTLKDLYPDSTTYLRIYQGPSSANPAQVRNVTSSYVVIDDSIPRDRTLVLEKLDKYCKKEGLHTMEILHKTPFGIDILWSGSVRVDRTVEFNGTMYTGE